MPEPPPGDSGHPSLSPVVAALGPDWDPVAALRSENEAYALLYSGLDAEQQRTYDRLVAAGVLPDEDPGRAAAH
ncbi:hypothetical protein GTW37_04465 [Streptomyces sp. SID4931]|nr:hypothetical protein [Streptomyces sp. SID4931]SCF68094.1 hypothetical protein GA0115255_102605 [Streptomyces sp. Ncost-T6T-2b]